MPQFPHLYNGNDSNNRVVMKIEQVNAWKYLEELLADRKPVVSANINVFMVQFSAFTRKS